MSEQIMFFEVQPTLKKYPNFEFAHHMLIKGSGFDAKGSEAINNHMLSALEESAKAIFIVLDFAEFDMHEFNTLGFFDILKSSNIYSKLFKHKNLSGVILIFDENKPSQKVLTRLSDIGEKMVMEPFGMKLYRVKDHAEANALIGSMHD